MRHRRERPTSLANLIELTSTTTIAASQVAAQEPDSIVTSSASTRRSLGHANASWRRQILIWCGPR